MFFLGFLLLYSSQLDSHLFYQADKFNISPPRKFAQFKIPKGANHYDIVVYSALNGIYFISAKNDRYGIRENIHNTMLSEMKERYSVEVNLSDLDSFQVENLRPNFNNAEENIKEAMKASNNLRFDNKGYKEDMCSSLYNVLTEFSHPTPKRLLEDEFTRRFIQPLFGPFLKEGKYNVIFGNRDESGASRIRTEKDGLKSDYGLKVVYKECEHHLLHVEVKGPNQVKEGSHHHPDFIKLCNLMKDEIDHLLREDCTFDIPIFGILIGGYSVRVFVMDLVYSQVYRLYEITSFHIPFDITDLSRLDRSFNSLIKLTVGA